MNDWKPTATIETLKRRAYVLDQIRSFFKKRDVLEVETPLLCSATITDLHLKSFYIEESGYLQTSPEFAMKRLLAFGSGDIYQLCKAFRNEEKGRYHNPEFTILEWYRLGFDHFQLMEEVESFFIEILRCPKAGRLSYEEVFQKYLNINPHVVELKTLQKLIKERCKNSFVGENFEDKDICLQSLFSEIIEPNIGRKAPTFIYHYPESQAILSRLHQENHYHVAERFELYYKGFELANGFHELSDAKEQSDRFDRDLKKRKKKELDVVKKDEHLIAALKSGLPNCSGVAVGIDRLIMLTLNQKHIKDVISFV